MRTEVFTHSEFTALHLLYGPYSGTSPHKAANEIIELAGRIKAERAVAAMQEPMQVKLKVNDER